MSISLKRLVSCKVGVTAQEDFGDDLLQRISDHRRGAWYVEGTLTGRLWAKSTISRRGRQVNWNIIVWQTKLHDTRLEQLPSQYSRPPRTTTSPRSSRRGKRLLLKFLHYHYHNDLERSQEGQEQGQGSGQEGRRCRQAQARVSCYLGELHVKRPIQHSAAVIRTRTTSPLTRHFPTRQRLPFAAPRRSGQQRIVPGSQPPLLSRNAFQSIELVN